MISLKFLGLATPEAVVRRGRRSASQAGLTTVGGLNGAVWLGTPKRVRVELWTSKTAGKKLQLGCHILLELFRWWERHATCFMLRHTTCFMLRDTTGLMPADDMLHAGTENVSCHATQQCLCTSTGAGNYT